MKRLLLAVCFVVFVSGVSFAKSNAKTGIGFSSQISDNGISSLALRYWGPGKTGFEGLLGFSFDNDNKFINIGAKILGIIKKEQNLSYYAFGLLGIENYSIKTLGLDESDTTFIGGAGWGVEFFLQGLPNLGFGAELGLQYNSHTKALSTSSDWLSNLGIRYYF